MHTSGILIGIGWFLIIGALHPMVIKVEYHIGKQGVAGVSACRNYLQCSLAVNSAADTFDFDGGAEFLPVLEHR